MRCQLIAIIIILFSGSLSCQIEHATESRKDVAEQIVERVCDNLSGKDFTLEDYLLMAVDLIQNDEFINKEYISVIEKNRNSPNIREKFDAYLKFIFRRDCSEYRGEYDKVDESYENELLVREGYVNNRNLIFDLLDNIELERLVQYFAVEDEEELRMHLNQMKLGFEEAKDQAFMHTTKLHNDELVFYNTFFNYVSGDEEFRIILVFNITGKKIIKYAFNDGEVDIIKE